MNILSLQKVGFTYPNCGKSTTSAVLENIDLEIEKGSFTSIMGPSGCGKSSLLRITAGLLTPTAGRIQFNFAQDPKHLPIGFMFQDHRLLPWRTVVANVKFGLEGLPLSKEQQEERALSTLKLVGLETFAARYPHQLSGGQRQRVALARALSVHPEVLLMDEPFASVDGATRRDLHEEILRIWRETGKTVIFVTHDPEEANHLAQRVITIGGQPGQIVEDRFLEDDEEN